MMMSVHNEYELKIINEPDMPSGTDAAIKRLLCECFPPDVAAFSASRHWHGTAPAYSVVHWQGERIMGHVGIVVREVRCGGIPAVVAGVQNFAVAHELRGRGLSQQLMVEAMAEAARRHVPYGLLFCVPRLERFYALLDWRRTDVSVTMVEKGERVPIPGKNIAMFKELAGTPFPEGDIDLQGMDW